MKWYLLGTKRHNLIPLVSQGWTKFSVDWLDYPGQQSLIKIEFTLTDPSKIFTAGIKKFLLRQYFDEISAVSTATSFYPGILAIVIRPPLNLSLSYSIEVTKIAYRRTVISEPPYSISVYASRVDL